MEIPFEHWREKNTGHTQRKKDHMLKIYDSEEFSKDKTSS